MWLEQTGGLGGQLVRAATVLVTGAFVALTLWRPSNRLGQALAATGLAGAALAVWMGALGIAPAAVRRAIETDLGAYHRALQVELTGSGSRELLAQMTRAGDTIAQLYPGLLALGAIGGLRLAWVWYHRIAERPVGPAPLPFTAFGFSDQMVWGWVVSLTLALLGTGGWQAAGANLLLVWAALYAARGLAVFSAGSVRVPGPVVATLAVVAMFLLPFVIGGLLLLGLADTWLDFRRRLATPSTGGFDP
ncbi:MAG TPA: DUF2232 domain-containing protein [Gemmatimonadales bacterium]|nr:DUF2232 domain-containing protein [Gemmatimonadales bacterium]